MLNARETKRERERKYVHDSQFTSFIWLCVAAFCLRYAAKGGAMTSTVLRVCVLSLHPSLSMLCLVIYSLIMQIFDDFSICSVNANTDIVLFFIIYYIVRAIT